MLSGSVALFMGKRAVEKAAAWKSPTAGLSHSGLEIPQQRRDFALFPLPRLRRIYLVDFFQQEE
jgi:hypothetical protein